MYNWQEAQIIAGKRVVFPENREHLICIDLTGIPNRRYFLIDADQGTLVVRRVSKADLAKYLTACKARPKGANT